MGVSLWVYLDSRQSTVIKQCACFFFQTDQPVFGHMISMGTACVPHIAGTKSVCSVSQRGQCWWTNKTARHDANCIRHTQQQLRSGFSQGKTAECSEAWENCRRMHVVKHRKKVDLVIKVTTQSNSKAAPIIQLTVQSPST